MSLLHIILNDELFLTNNPSRIMDQNFNHEINMHGLHPEDYFKLWHARVADKFGSDIATDEFEANLDVQQFKLKEIIVKVIDNKIVTVEAKHKENRIKHGFVSTHFVRKYILPEGYDIEKVAATLSSDSVLTITAPRLIQGKTKQRIVPIRRTDAPLKAKNQIM